MDASGLIWFVGLGGGIVVLGLAIAYGRMRGRPSKADSQPNNAWQQAADESGHPEVAKAPKAEPARPRDSLT